MSKRASTAVGKWRCRLCRLTENLYRKPDKSDDTRCNDCTKAVYEERERRIQLARHVVGGVIAALRGETLDATEIWQLAFAIVNADPYRKKEFDNDIPW